MQRRLHHGLQLGGQLAALRQLQVVLLVNGLAAGAACSFNPRGLWPEGLPEEGDFFGRQNVFDVQEHGAVPWARVNIRSGF